MLLAWYGIIAAIIIYSKLKHKNKWQLYSFVALFSVLPNTFGLRIGGTVFVLPFCLLYLFFCFAITIAFNSGKVYLAFTKMEKYAFVLCCSGLLFPLICTMIVGYSSAYEFFLFVNFSIVLFLFVNSQIGDKEDVILCLKALALGAAVLFAVALINYFLGVDCARSLNMSSEDTYITLADRLRYSRVRTTYNSITFGYYCAFLQPILVFLFQYTKNVIYIALAIIGIACAALTTTRGALVLIAFCYFLLVLKKKKFNSRNILTVIGIALGIVVLMFIVSKTMPSLWNRFSNVFEITINAFNKRYKNKYVNNNDALGSRTVQFTVVRWLAKNSRLFYGFGFDANSKELIRYYVDNRWVNYQAIDSGFPAMIAIGGLAHLVSYLFIFGILIKKGLGEYLKTKKDYFFMVSLLGMLLLVGNIATVFYRDNIAVIIISILLCAIKKKNIKEQGLIV